MMKARLCMRNKCKRLRWSGFLGLAALHAIFAACTENPLPQAAQARDSLGVTISELAADGVDGHRDAMVGRSPAVILGAGEAGEGSRFFRITGIQLIGNDRVAVASDASKQIMILNEIDSVVESHGRVGQGPGEYQHLQLIRNGNQQMLAGFDALQSRVTLHNLGDSTVATHSFAGLPIGYLIPEHRFSNGELLVRNDGGLPKASEKGLVHGYDAVIRVSAVGAPIVQYGKHAAADRVLRPDGPGHVIGGDPPYKRELLIAATDSFVFVSSSGNFIIDRYDLNGRLDRSIRILQPRVPVTKDMIVRYRARVMEGVKDPYGIREWTMLSADDVFPDSLPAFDVMIADRAGRIWLRESVPEDTSMATWLVLTTGGDVIGRVEFPAGFRAMDADSLRVAGVWTDPDGGQQVHVYEIIGKR
jgi:hypothetical protein